MRANVARFKGAGWRHGQRGQTIIFVVLGISLVFIAVLGFAVDFGNLWFHRQAAQTAADAACTAASMNMLDNAQGGNSGGFLSDDFDCGGGGNPLPNSAPCKYLKLNGYNVTGLRNSSASSSAAFKLVGAASTVPVCTTPPDPKYTMCVPPGSALGPEVNPVVEVTLIDRIRAPFFSLVSSRNTIDVPAKSSCGVVLATSALPVLVLYPRTDEHALSGNGGINIAFYGGPNRSIQVDGRGTEAVELNGGTIDVSRGGPSQAGSDFGVTGNTPQPSVLTPAVGHYTSPASPTSDPFALVNAPGIPNFPNSTRRPDGSDNPTVTEGTYGCPAATCIHFTPGYYPSGINVTSTAIFDPGIYYVLNGFRSTACMQQSTAQGDGSGGTAFYFADSSSVDIDSSSPGGRCTDPFNVSSGPSRVLTFPNYLANGVGCTPISTIPGNVVSSSITGTVLLAPCTGPDPNTNLCSPNCDLNAGNGLGDQLNTFNSGLGTWGTTDPGGIQRGILFFQNRSTSAAAAPVWNGNDQFLLSGTMYFHQCVTAAGADIGTGCDTADAFNDEFSFGGGSGFDSYLLGNIVADKLDLSGAKMTIDLNPSAGYWILKASLLQ